MKLSNTPLDSDDAWEFTKVYRPHELSLEEKDQLLFILLEHLKLELHRSGGGEIHVNPES